MKQQNKLTLIELMVVVAVISILISFLIPTLSQSRATARQAVCANNLKQMYYGAMLYVGDKGYYPQTNFIYASYIGNSIHDFIAPYVMDIKNSSDRYPALNQSHAEGGIFNCPSFDESLATERGMNSWDPRGYYSGYTSNRHLFNAYLEFNPEGKRYKGKPRKTSLFPPGMILHTTGNATGIVGNNFDERDGLFQYHGGNTANYLYADGHVSPSKTNHLLTNYIEPWYNPFDPVEPLP